MAQLRASTREDCEVHAIPQAVQARRHLARGADDLLTQASADRVNRHSSFRLAVAGIAYLFAIREFFSTPEFPRRVIVIGLVLAALWHLPFLLMPPGVR